MLNILRDSLKKGIWPKVVLVIVAVGLVAYLGAYFSCDSGPRGGGDWAAIVGEVEIPIRTFLLEARSLDQRLRRMYGKEYEQVKPQFQIGSAAIGELITQEMIRQDAAQLGLTVSQGELIERIRTMDQHKDESGRFVGRERYEQHFNRVFPGGVIAYEQLLMKDLLKEKWINLVARPVDISEAELEAAYRQRSERTTANYIVFRSSDQKVDTAISGAEAARWYEEHQESYLREEGRMIRYLLVSRQELIDSVTIGGEEVSAYYEANLDNYSHPEQRNARFIFFPVEPGATDEAREEIRLQAEGVLQRLREGEDFSTLADALSQEPGSTKRGGETGFFSRGEMVPFEQAAFATAVGELAPVVDSQFGSYVIQVTGERPAGSRPLEEVEGDIRRLLEARRSQELVTSEAQRLHAELQVAEQFEEVASREGYAVERIFINPQSELPALRPSPEFVNTVMELEPGTVSPPLQTAGGGMALVVVDEIIPTSVPPLEEILSTVESDILDARGGEAALAAAERALERNDSFYAVARALGEEVRESGSLAPGQPIPGTGGPAPELQEKLFGPDVRAGERGVAAVPDGALVYEVTEREQFDPAAFAEVRGQLHQELLRQRQELLLSSILKSLGERLGVETNEEFVQRYND
jgi:peptidyl-prolyl cis-trans isomerase D